MTSGDSTAKVIPIHTRTIEANEQQLKIDALIARSTNLTITVSNYEAVVEDANAIKTLIKAITEEREPQRKKLRAAVDNFLAETKTLLSPLEEAATAIRASLNVFVRTQEEIRQENERKARLQAEEDAKRETEKLLKQAAKAEEKGQNEKSESLLEKAENVYAAPVSVESAIPKTTTTVSGAKLTQAKDLKITVINPLAFIKALCEQNPGAVNNILKIGDGPLKAFIKSNGIDRYPGITIENTVAVRI